MQPLQRTLSHLARGHPISSHQHSNIAYRPLLIQIGNNLNVIQAKCLHTRREFDGKSQDGKRSRGYYYTTILASAGLVSSLVAYKKIQAFSRGQTQPQGPGVVSQSKSIGAGAGEEKVFSRKEVAEHDCLEKGVWITYKGNVYDISKFIEHHPGGSHTIMMGAGGDVEPFWQTYTVHHANEVQGLLAQYKIGQLTLEDQLATQEQVRDENNPYANDPRRNPLLNIHSQQPFNAESPPKLLLPTYITPTDIFFVRNHLPVPEVDPQDYSLSVCVGSDGDPDNLKVLAEFTLDDLRTKFKPHSVDSVIQCSGNRRSDLKKLKEIKGLDWKVGAIGNARWTGVRLIDLLDYLGVMDDKNKIINDLKHIQMEGLDCDMTGQSYGASISADIALDPNKQIILAYEMNGQPLTRDHGFPLRFVAPGVTGARNVKWLGKIILSQEESHSHWQRKDYMSFSPNVDMFNLDFKQSVSIQETPVQSAICDPVEGEEIKLVKRGDAYVLPVKGYAYSGGGKMVIRVDVSIDGGANWITAQLLDTPKDSQGNPDFERRNKTYSWTRWSLDVPLSEELIRGQREVEVLCRAFDAAYNSQPERAETIWNVRGVVNNSWHRVKLNVKLEDNNNNNNKTS